MTAPVLELRGLRKRFGALAATDDVSLTLRPGETHALIGPNGAGKTTLMHQISGVLRPDAGAVILEGADVTRLAPHRRAALGLGRTFQITSIIPEFTVLETATLAAQARDRRPLRVFGRAAAADAAAQAARAALARVGLDARAEAVSGDLSHGEKRLLELALALAGAPRALLLDEPMAGMGRAESAALVQTLAALKAVCPMLLVEHDMDAVFALADRVSVLAAGRIVASGTPQQVRADPAARAAYLGEDA